MKYNAVDFEFSTSLTSLSPQGPTLVGTGSGSPEVPEPPGDRRHNLSTLSQKDTNTEAWCSSSAWGWQCNHIERQLWRIFSVINAGRILWQRSGYRKMYLRLGTWNLYQNPDREILYKSVQIWAYAELKGYSSNDVMLLVFTDVLNYDMRMSGVWKWRIGADDRDGWWIGWS